MTQNYYTTLGIEKSASKDEIKKAFHRLARKYHPDNKSTGDEQRFKEINEAYQTLSDDRKRSEYDTYGHVFQGGGAQGARHGFEGFAQNFNGFEGFDFEDIFDMFGGGKRTGGRMRRGRDISIDLEIDFTEAIFGTERKVLLTKTSVCDSCNGSGAKENTGYDKCAKCNGQGKLHETRSSFLGSFTSVKECGTCNGEGNVPKEKCNTCRGACVLKRQEEITIRVPAGINNGEVIRLSGTGESVARGIPGDLYIKIHVGEHRLFRREGNNLVINLDIKLSDAILGAEYSIELLDKSLITLKVPKGVSIGEVLRIKGKGIPHDRGSAGDLLVKLNIQLPKNLSSKAKEMFEKLKKEGI
jgi:molecular chaperone DnaJ